MLTNRMGHVVLAAAAVLMLTLGVALASAEPSARTYGVARAVFQAGPTGGVTIFTRSPSPHGAPSHGVPTGSPEDARIYPLVDDAEYCESGWHLAGLVIGDDPALNGGHQALFDLLSRIDVRFALDGRALETERTAVKRFTRPEFFGLEEAFVFHAGAFLAPGTLTVGAHSLTTTIDDPVYGLDEWSVPFTVLPC